MQGQVVWEGARLRAGSPARASVWVFALALAGCFDSGSAGDGGSSGGTAAVGATVVAGSDGPAGGAGTDSPSGPGVEPPIAGNGTAGGAGAAGSPVPTAGAAGGLAGGAPGAGTSGAGGTTPPPTADLPDGGVCMIGELDCRCETSGRCADGLMCYSSRCVPAGSVSRVDAGSQVDFDCFELPPCDVDSVCEGGLHCIQLPSCMRAGCIDLSRACQIECGTPECGVLESYPEQLSCG